MKSLRNTGLGLALCVTGVTVAVAGELTIATVKNGHMIEMQALTPDFEAANPGITVKWVTLDENTLRSRVTTDITTKGGQFDIMTIAMYEAPIWDAKGWLEGLDSAPDMTLMTSCPPCAAVSAMTARYTRPRSMAKVR